MGADMFGVDRMMNNQILFVLSVIFLWLVWIPVGAYVAWQKGRSIFEGLVLGSLGPFGALIEALLPTKSPRAIDNPNTR